ncbi:hypothetical protein Scep_019448 [Stephania cephalantha]|uniref:Scarecrow-like protein 23 n=1 Tax=Stephania cephalantha TaxID=152367 RepID=A0AAP0IAS8_9MAGN
MQLKDEDELLDLSLAVAPRNNNGDYKNRRKRMTNNGHGVCLDSQYEGHDEGKIYGLLQMREQMLKLDPMKQGVVEDGKGPHLIHLLLISATAVDENDLGSAIENLCELYQTVSLTGDAVQRVAAYFADVLTARLLNRKSMFYDLLMKDPTPDEEFAAFTEMYKASPYYQFAHFTANQAIIDAFEEEEEHKNRALHVIDFNISYGFQWPSLIQSLSQKANDDNRISLRITGYSRSMEELVETESRLMSFAKGCSNLAFEFQGMLMGSKPITSLRKKKNETIAVNLMFYLHTLTHSSQISETLKSVYSLKPSIVTLVEHEGSRSTRSFISKFMESLHYFAAMFDSLDDCLSPDSTERLIIESNHLGKEIKRIMKYEKGRGSHQRYEKLETWKGRMESEGLLASKQSSRSVIQAKLLLKIRSQYCSPFMFEGGLDSEFWREMKGVHLP